MNYNLDITDLLNRPNFTDVSVGPKSLARLNALYDRSSGSIRDDGAWSVVDHDGFRCIDFFYPEGTWGNDTAMNEWKEVATGPEGLDELWIGFEFKWEEGFVYPLAGKFFGVVCGNFNDTDGRFAGGGQGPASEMVTNDLAGSMRLRPVQLENGNLGLAFYIYDHVMTTEYGRGGIAGSFGEMIPGQWHKIQVRNVMNFPLSENNGVCQVWLDGVLVGSYGGIAWSRDFITSHGFQMLALNFFIGGSSAAFASNHNQHLWKKSVFAWTTNNPIGNDLFLESDTLNTLGMGIIGGGGGSGTITGVTLSNQSFTYDGSAKSLAISGTLPTGGSVVYSNNSRTNVGTQTVTATCSAPDYDDLILTATLTITPATITGITFPDGTFVYNGSTRTLTISGTLPSGTSVAYLNNTRVNIGSQEDTATITGSNYTTLVLTATLTITDGTITGITLADGSFVYDGSSKSLAISGTLPSGTSVVYSNNSRTNAGAQEVTATISGEGYTTLILTADLTITRANVTGITFQGQTFTYDGTEKAIFIIGTLPSGTSVVYLNNTRTEPGTQQATATVSGDNYNTRVLNAYLLINEVIPPDTGENEIAELFGSFTKLVELKCKIR